MARNQLTHEQFALAFSALKEEASSFQEKRPTDYDAAKRLSQICGFPISPATIPKLKKVSGVTWQGKRSRTPRSRFPNDFRALVAAVYNIAKDLGTVPETLQAMYDRLCREIPDEPAPTPPPAPVEPPKPTVCKVNMSAVQHEPKPLPKPTGVR